MKLRRSDLCGAVFVLSLATSLALPIDAWLEQFNPGSNFFSTIASPGNSLATIPEKAITIIEEKPQQIGNGTVRSFVTLDNNKHLLSVGVTFTQAALSNLPTTSREYELSLPPTASASAFRYVVITWNPQGHQPTGIYDVPHFDFHFYTLSSTERQRITAVGDDRVRVLKPPLPAYVPMGYAPEPTPPAPQEGQHWINPRSPEFQGQTFTKTFIYGTYDGEIVFAEPMLTKALLQTYPDFTEAISLPEAYSQSAYYPTAYSVHFDQNSQIYSVSLDGLTFRSQNSSSTRIESYPDVVP